jgi:predicted nucleotidyltransferase
MNKLQIQIQQDKIDDFCLRWRISELALFGSVLRDDFRRDSDVDILVSFSEEAQWSLYEWVEMLEELERIFGRQVDLLSRRSLRNPFRRHEILSTQEVLYAA